MSDVIDRICATVPRWIKDCELWTENALAQLPGASFYEALAVWEQYWTERGHPPQQREIEMLEAYWEMQGLPLLPPASK